MKNVIVAGVLAFGLVGCGNKEEVAPAPEAAPVTEVAADPCQPQVAEPTAGEPAAEPTVVAPAEGCEKPAEEAAQPTSEPKIG